MAAVDILVSEPPKAKFYSNMNLLFVLLDLNEECGLGYDYSRIAISLTAYGEKSDGSIDLDNAIETSFFSYPRFQINERFQNEGFDPYNIWLRLKNYWYGMEVFFTYEYHAHEDGSNIYPSKFRRYIIDNRVPTITGHGVSAFIKGALNQNFQKRPYYNIWMDEEKSIVMNTGEAGDLISNKTGSLMKQIVTIDIPEDYIHSKQPDPDFIGLTKYILNDDELGRVVETYFGGIPQLSSTLPIKLIWNSSFYYVYFKGDLSYLGI